MNTLYSILFHRVWGFLVITAFLDDSSVKVLSVALQTLLKPFSSTLIIKHFFRPYNLSYDW